MATLTWKGALRDVLLTLATLAGLGVFGLQVLLLVSLPCRRSTDSRSDEARMDLAYIKQAVKLFHTRHGRWPSTREGLAVLVKEHELEKIPLDPWERPYRYALSGKGPPRLWSNGADGTPGGEGEDADIF